MMFYDTTKPEKASPSSTKLTLIQGIIRPCLHFPNSWIPIHQQFCVLIDGNSLLYTSIKKMVGRASSTMSQRSSTTLAMASATNSRKILYKIISPPQSSAIAMDSVQAQHFHQEGYRLLSDQHRCLCIRSQCPSEHGANKGGVHDVWDTQS